MSIIDEARKLEQSHIALGIGTFISVVAPGFLTIYHYKPGLVSSLDTFKLLIFSASLSLPLVIVNYLIVAVTLDSTMKDKDDDVIALIVAMAMTCLILYGALLISYFAFLTFKWHLGAVTALQVLLLLLAVFIKKTS